MEKQHQQQQPPQQQDDKYEQVPLSDASSSVEDEVKSRGVTAGAGHSGDYAPYPKVEMEDPAQLQKERQAWTSTQQNPPPPPLAQQQQPQGNPYVEATPLPPENKGLVENVRGVLGRWGKKVGDATKRAEDFTGNVWQHLKTGPSLADTAMERLAQGTKVLAEGGYEKIFRQTFEVQPDEQLKKTFACYLSTTAGPVIGTLYLSSEKLAFCSDEPLAYQVDANKTEWSFYKVTLPLYQMKAVNASANRSNPAEKYIQVITTDNHEFWFMGFVNYDKGLKSLQAVLNKEEP